MAPAAPPRFADSLKRLRRSFYRRLHAGAAGSPRFRKMVYNAENRLALAAVESGEYYVVNTEDKYAGRRCYVDRRACDSEKIRAVKKLLPGAHAGGLLIDAGANIGTVCIHAVRCGLFEKAVAVEPEPGNFRLLKTNTVLNGLEDKITLVNAALGARDGEILNMELSADNHGDHRIRSAGAGAGAGLYGEDRRQVIEVKTAAVDTLAPDLDKNSALLWMDTQGYEGFVLEGAAKTVSAGVPVCMEFWPYGLKRAGAYEPLMAALAAAPYKRFADLENPDGGTAFSTDVLEQTAARLGGGGAFTDVLIW